MFTIYIINYITTLIIIIIIIGQLDKKHWYEHIPKSVETSQEAR